MHNNFQHFSFLLLGSIAIVTSTQSPLAAGIFSNAEEKNIQDRFVQAAQEPDAVMFTPPEGWHMADPKSLPPSVKIMVVGKGEQNFPPSINLGTEKYGGSLKQYLKQIKAINSSQGNEWKDLGTIHTEAGDASYSQAMIKTEWGEVKMMHVILLKNGMIYILTAAALKSEFSKYYKDFFNSFRSLRVNPTVYEMIKDPNRRAQLEQAEKHLKSWNASSKEQSPLAEKQPSIIFENEQFQKNEWEPFKAMLTDEYNDMGLKWREHLLDKIQGEITEQQNSETADAQ